MKKLELLAPCRDMQTLKVAINNGADALYFGVDQFNARANVQNFTLENLKENIDIAHLFGVKTYLTLNILFKDEEYENVSKLIETTSKYGIDGYIIQDIGLYYFIKHTFPNLEIHASTQMGIENYYGAKFLKELGYKRIVLARETGLNDIKEIYEKLGIEIEYFIQGALCVSFSGNCYLCSLLAGSSGNRGKCKQFCRLPYSLECSNQKKLGYFLSTKDFCMLPKLKELADSGVVSFKIEGRARRAGYIGQAVKTYRKAIDNEFSYDENDIIDLKKVYNRGNYIPGYLGEEKIIYSKAQNHIGVVIGKVISVNNGKKFNEITIASKHELKNGDVVKFFDNGIEKGILTANDVRKIKDGVFKLTTTNTVSNNLQVSLIVDEEKESEVLNSIRKISVDAEFSAYAGQKAKLKLIVNNTSAIVESDDKLEQAKNSPLTQQDCFNQISKMGEFFSLQNLKFETNNVFMTKSQINQMRRNAIKLLTENILKKYEKSEKLSEKCIKNTINCDIFDENKPRLNIVSFDDFEKINQTESYDLLIFKPSEFDKEKILSLYEKYSNQNVYVSLPIIASQVEAEKIEKIMSECANWGIVANNYYALRLKPKEKTIIGESMNVFNSYAVKFYASHGYDKIILSNEIGDYAKIKNSGVTLMQYSEFYPEFMNFRHCPVKENIGGNCAKCMFDKNIKYKLNNNTFDIVRRKILSCQFILKSQKKYYTNVSEKYSKIVEIY